jgi:hypothetical protein
METPSLRRQFRLGKVLSPLSYRRSRPYDAPVVPSYRPVRLCPFLCLSSHDVCEWPLIDLAVRSGIAALPNVEVLARGRR